jgi:hypothetical protein
MVAGPKVIFVDGAKNFLTACRIFFHPPTHPASFMAVIKSGVTHRAARSR